MLGILSLKSNFSDNYFAERLLVAASKHVYPKYASDKSKDSLSLVFSEAII